ncbi:PilZ domain-containing protein [Croceicoccus marinus]|uniref:PilZ domain-containing protein n=1 Tax=Croceicoccus marinus TaxID=450378 RepID=A0A1Z1FGA9_9SPHN|nr:PilZ domain-containing protein [Croceicoccus marinus]ARU17763.1 PilZ domain-containing protein [Croceicoccus marinus]
MFVGRIKTQGYLRDGRTKIRRIIQIEVEARTGHDGSPAIVRNLSETGLLLETRASLEPNDILYIDLPISGECAAEIVWIDGVRHGCRFLAPIPKATVSAAELLSPHLDRPKDVRDEASHQDIEIEQMLAKGEQQWASANFSLILFIIVTATFIFAIFNIAA